MAGGEPRFGTTATYMRRHDHRASCLSIEIDRLHDRLYNEYQVFSAASVRKWSKFGLIDGVPAMPQPNDLSRSLVALDQNSTIIAVIEMSQSSWLVAGMLRGIERQPRRKLEP